MGSSALLGPAHPLVRAESRLRTLRAQLAVTGVLGVVTLALSPLLGAPALRLAMGAGSTLSGARRRDPSSRARACASTRSS